jgi:7-cyano-7-deazaguanine synthase
MKKVLIVLSGGQDSVTCLVKALSEANFEVHAIGFKYGQKHATELECAQQICNKFSVPFTIHEIPSLVLLADSALTTAGDVGAVHHRDASLPASFVPNRNALFLTIAHAYAQKIGAERIVTGVCQTDYSGYPDCREEFVQMLERALNVGYNTNIQIETPLMHLTKAETFLMAFEAGHLDTVLEMSHTCYNGDRTNRHEWGYGCGECPACKLRANGWDDFCKFVGGK